MTKVRWRDDLSRARRAWRLIRVQSLTLFWPITLIASCGALINFQRARTFLKSRLDQSSRKLSQESIFSNSHISLVRALPGNYLHTENSTFFKPCPTCRRRWLKTVIFIYIPWSITILPRYADVAPLSIACWYASFPAKKGHRVRSCPQVPSPGNGRRAGAWKAKCIWQLVVPSYSWILCVSVHVRHGTRDFSVLQRCLFE